MKKIIYYVTDHGMGHATRSVAIIRELQKHNIEVIIRNSNLRNFFTQSLLNIKIIPGKTDVGPVFFNDNISIDEKKTQNTLQSWIENLDFSAKKEYNLISKLNPNLVISDISAMPFLTAHKLSIPSIGISNFSWSDVIDDFITKNHLSIIDSAYELADLAIQLPLGTEMKHFKNKKKVGLVCKTPTLSKTETRKKLGVKNSEQCIFINLGNYFQITPKIKENVKIITTGAKINSKNVINIDPWIEGQNLASASDLVICKCGYGMISECITNGVPFLYLLSEKHKEQRAISRELDSKGISNRITENDLYNLDYDYNFISSIKSPIKEKNDVKHVINIILEYLH